MRGFSRSRAYYVEPSYLSMVLSWLNDRIGKPFEGSQYMQGKRDRDWYLQYKRGFPLIIAGLGTWLGTCGAGHGLLFLGLGYGLVLISSYTRSVPLVDAGMSTVLPPILGHHCNAFCTSNLHPTCSTMKGRGWTDDHLPGAVLLRMENSVH